MKYDNLPAFEKHVAGAAPRHFANVYLILSKEEFDSKQAANFLIESFSSNLKPFFQVFDGASVNGEDLLTTLYSPSFFSATQLLWIRQVDKLKKSILEKLESFIETGDRSHYLVLTASILSRQSSFYKKIEKAGIILDLPELKAWEKEKKWIEWVGKQAASARKSISPQTCQYLVKQVGVDPSTLYQEMEKLFCYVGEKKEITRQDVQSICSAFPFESIWQLGEFIFHRHFPSALKIAKALLAEGGGFLPLLRQIRAQFQTEFQVATIMANGGRADAITQEFPYMKGAILERHMEFVRNYGIPSLKKGMLAIDSTERQVKNSQIDEELLIELLLIQLIHH